MHLNFDPDRIAENFTIVAVDAQSYEVNNRASGDRGGDAKNSKNHPFNGWCLRAAISLFSHKYRTDIPSELMNLLNVRFYIYERVIFHPTKCAAGSMLGTALQILGWRKVDGVSRRLPDQLRFVGDDVFLHDIRASLDFVIKLISDIPDHQELETKMIVSNPSLGSVHNGLPKNLLELHVGRDVHEVLGDLEAARMLLNRLTARRFFRPVFRALPNSTNKKLQAGPEALAEFFKNPDVRFKAERDIEARAKLPLGTITIHCPKRTTAQKIANVFLTKPDNEGKGNDDVRKLKDIHLLDDEIFRDHESAVKAVEKMYSSMWRLVVYVAPEHLTQRAAIGEAAAKVIFRAIDVHQHSTEDNDYWPVDPYLKDELEVKADAPRGTYVSDDSDLTPFGELLGEIGEEIFKLAEIDGTLQTTIAAPGGIDPGLRDRIKDAVLRELAPGSVTEGGTSTRNLEPVGRSRTQSVLTILTGYIKRIDKKKVEQFHIDYEDPFAQLSETQYQELEVLVRSATTESAGLELKGADRKGSKFSEARELISDFLHSLNIATPAPYQEGLLDDIE